MLDNQVQSGSFAAYDVGDEVPGEAPRPAWRIVIADTHPLMLEGLAQILRAFAVAAIERCTSGADVVTSIVARGADLAILDMRLPGLDALSVLRELKRQGITTPVIVVTGPLADSEVLECVQLGLRGLVTRDAPLTVIEHCVRAVLGGRSCLDQALVGRAMGAALARETALREFAAVLTVREMQVLELAVAGLGTHDAASRLHVTDGTLKVHLHHIYQKLNVPNRDALVALARDRGLGTYRTIAPVALS